MCILSTIKTAIKIVASIVLAAGCAAIAVGIWAIIGGGGPLANYLKDESWIGIQIIGGILIGAGAVLAVDFALACLNSTKILSTCGLPLFLIWALFTSLVFVGAGICCLTFMGDMLQTSLKLAFTVEGDIGAKYGQGALGSAEKDFDCCGVYKCNATNTTYYDKYNCSGSCLNKRGCVDAVMSDLLVIFSYPLGIGCFAVAGVTCLMFIFSILLCCLPG